MVLCYNGSMEDNSNKKLIIVLLLLFAVIVGLGVTIGVLYYINTSTTSGGEVVEVEDDSEDEEMKRLAITEELMMQRIEKIEKETEELVNQQPVDVVRINKIYDEAIEYAKKNERRDYIMPLLMKRNELYTSHGMDREALDALALVDPNLFSDADKYRLYYNVVVLAEKIGDSELLEKYNKLLDGVSESYFEHLRWFEEEEKKTEAELETLYGNEESEDYEDL